MISAHRTWGVAYLLRARVKGEMAMEEQSLLRFQRAIEDFEDGFELLDGSNFAISEGLQVLGRAVDLAAEKMDSDESGVDFRRWFDRVETLTTDLDRSRDNIFGLAFAASFQRNHGDREQADQIERSLIRLLEKGTFSHAAEVLEYDHARVPLAWHDESAGIEAQLCYALSLACAKPTDLQRAEIDTIVNRVVTSDRPLAFHAVALDIPCVLGDQDMLDRLCQKAKSLNSYATDYRWWRRYVDFHAGKYPEEKEWISLAQPFSRSLGFAYHAVGLRALKERKLEKAKDYFGRVAQTGQIYSWCYHNAKIFKKKLDNGWLKNEDPSPIKSTARKAENGQED